MSINNDDSATVAGAEVSAAEVEDAMASLEEPETTDATATVGVLARGEPASAALPSSKDFHDQPDAPTKELVIYSLGAIIDEIGTAAFRNLNALLVIGFGFTPIIAGLFGGLKVLCDGILDPVVAHFSDNTRSRWGRRRPYILAGGLLMAIFSLTTWLALPETNRIKPNAEMRAKQKEKDKERAEKPASPKDPTAKKPGAWQNISKGFKEVFASNPQDRRLLIFLLIMFFGVSIASTLYNATYWALGIEVAPSYEGRTRAMAWRQLANNLIAIVASGFLPFCFLPIFRDFKQGNLVLAVLMLCIGVPLFLMCFFGVRERTVVVRKKGKKPSFFRSAFEIGSTLEFWRVTGLFFVLGKAMGIFQVFGMYLSIYYVFRGDVLRGTTYGAGVHIVSVVIGLAAIPLVVWMCNRFDKHNAFRVALGLLLIGSVIKYFCYNPDYPLLLFIVPFFYALGHSSVYNILGTMMADITDLDELQCGERREGMFGAVVSVINKSTASLSAVVAGALVVAVGFDISQGAEQPPEVFHKMRILFSIVPAVTGLLGFALLIKYPLTQARVAEIKEQLAVLRARRATESASAH